MKVSVGELAAYSYCPWLPEELDCSSVIPPYSHEAVEYIVRVLSYVFIKQLESGKLASWDGWSNRWVRSFWKTRDLEDAKSSALHDGCTLLLKEIYDWANSLDKNLALVNFEYEISAKDVMIRSYIPLIHITGENEVELTFWDMPTNVNYFRRNLWVRVGALAIKQSLPDHKISLIRGLSFDFRKFKLTENIIYPNDVFIDNSVSDVASLVSAMQSDIRYANYSACNTCRAKRTCKR